ncbi:MAG: hypothetical protein HZT40_05810 [Candidatus Thiothrix singaporensis]|uniref:AAA domain-containing protein n=1 Tax=Candidatus Thiothrix singaporensis TaxID=2799669 RepID=A0A7L6AQ19_9GAMM|nr:MAG: hypothetical protein HZT40_05810 [Candidatus Thiothrix singaporensis]
MSSDYLKQLVDHAEQGGVDFDLVMIDSPPVLGLADALLIGNRTHATLFVVACNETRRSPLRARMSACYRQEAISLVSS